MLVVTFLTKGCPFIKSFIWLSLPTFLRTAIQKMSSLPIDVVHACADESLFKARVLLLMVTVLGDMHAGKANLGEVS